MRVKGDTTAKRRYRTRCCREQRRLHATAIHIKKAQVAADMRLTWHEARQRRWQKRCDKA